MRGDGLREVPIPRRSFLAERPERAAGSVVVPSMEWDAAHPHRDSVPRDPDEFRDAPADGHRRGRQPSLLAAVLDKVCGLHLSNHDIFINVAGGVKVSEPAIDLGIAPPWHRAFLDRAAVPGTVVCGEVGSGRGDPGSVMPMSASARRRASGFSRCILPFVAPRERRDGRRRSGQTCRIIRHTRQIHLTIGVAVRRAGG